jgi:hypothetical protein
MADALLLDTAEIDPAIRLPRHFERAQQIVRAFDPALRLRQSVSRERRRQGCGFILERKTRYTKPPDSEKDRDTQIATRDGYLIIGPVHISHLIRPESIIERLKEGGDLNDRTAAQQFTQIIAAQDADLAAKRKFRRDELKGFYAESFDVLDRVGDNKSHAERMRINNAGVDAAPLKVTDRRAIRPEDVADSLQPRSTSAGESPAKESSDVHTPSTASPRENSELHDRSVH